MDVIAHNSTEVYKGKAVDVRQVGRELNVRYVLEGSVQREGDQIRVTAQLIDAASDAHLWSDLGPGSPSAEPCEKQGVGVSTQEELAVGLSLHDEGLRLLDRLDERLHPEDGAHPLEIVARMFG
jgi:hypothetical protein